MTTRTSRTLTATTTPVDRASAALSLPVAWALLALAAGLLGGCGSETQLPDDARTAEADRQVRARWGKALEDLPAVKLVGMSPNNENIQNEFAWAFSLHHAVEFGQRVDVEWREVGGGATSMETYLVNVYRPVEVASSPTGQPATSAPASQPRYELTVDSSGIDIMWGGGEYSFSRLARLGLLEPLTVSREVLDQIPLQLQGVRLRDPDNLWIGSALSGFGFLYNRTILEKCGRLPPPATWDDLDEPRFADLICLTDPTQSGSAAALYMTIAQSADSWPAGWAKLLAILANAKRFTDSAGTAANAPVVGEAPIAACIDFYGVTRVAEAPDELVYISPRGQTPFTPDPIGILRNPPHRQTAERFVEFVLSRKGQALWALPPGHPDGPAIAALGRTPIRMDTFETYAGQMLPRTANPYELGQAMELGGYRRRIDFGLLRSLIAKAAIDNRDGMRAARSRLIELGHPPDRLAAFNTLPDNVATVEAMAHTAQLMRDPVRKAQILSGWQEHFRRVFGEVAR